VRRLLVCGLALLAALVPAPSQAASVPVVVIDGRGFGHGVGMAQEGAFWMGAAGSSTEQILGQFYPGAAIGRGRGPVRIPVLDGGAAPSSAVVAFPNGGEVREVGSGPSSPGFPLQVEPGGQARVTWDGGRYRVDVAQPPPAGQASRTTDRASRMQTWQPISYRHGQVPTLPPPPSSTTTTAAPPPTAPTPTTQPPASSTTTSTTAPAPPDAPDDTSPSPPPSSPPPSDAPAPAPPPPAASGPSTPRTVAAIPVDGGAIGVPERQRRYRGYVEATAGSGTLRLVNVVDVETYLKGMGEVRDPSWPQASLRAQAIAARTYALRAMAIGGELCDTERCQVYLGADAEYAAMNKAVDSSREQVLVFRNALISAVYSANGGGHSASREEGFGVPDAGDVPYLRPAPYLTKDPGPWSVTVALSDVGARVRYPGDVADVRIARAGPSGRAIEVVVDGSAGPQSVQGIAFDAALGLKSTLFSLRVEAADAPPPAPPPSEDVTLQAPPEQAAEIAVTETAGATTVPRVSNASGTDGQLELDGLPEELIVVAVWLVTAVAAAAVVVSPIGGPLPRRRPSPSAPTSGDGSP
jgi:SpoIID/LytB domain protein